MSITLERTQSSHTPTSANFIDITKVSKELKTSGLSGIEDLSYLTIPLSLPATCKITYDALRVVSGNRMQIFLNGKLVQEISYEHASGEQNQAIDISKFLKKGINEIRVKCLVTTDKNYQNSDTAEMTLMGNSELIIRKKYSTKNSLEPFDQIWMLRVIEA